MAAPCRACIRSAHALCVIRRLLGAIFLDRQVAEHRGSAVIVVDETDTRDKGFDDMNLLKRCDDEQLQVELLKQVQSILRRFVGAATECLVDHNESESTRA